MQSIELTAKSVDEARVTAAAKFGVSPNDVQVTVIEETKGLFGKTNVRVRAESTAAVPTPAPVPAPEPVAVAAAGDELVVDESMTEAKGGRGRGKKMSDTPAETLGNIEETLNAPPPAEVAEASE